MGTVRFYLDLLPRLRAEESMQEATRVGMGAATLKVQDRREVWREWQEDARDPQAPVPAPKAQTIGAMFGAGVAIVMEPPRRPQESGETHGE